MRRPLCLLPVLCLLAAAAATVRSATPPPLATVACDAELDVVDPDPAGLNVRRTPDVRQDNVIAVLRPEGEWVGVHVIGQRGQWLLIDQATVFFDAQGETPDVFNGRGWVHISGIGVFEPGTGGHTVLRARPAEDAPVVFRTAEPQPQSRLLACQGRYLRLQVGSHVGWTDAWCSNGVTTCP
jgi:hypothetical protein